jgi:hypothetical protein
MVGGFPPLILYEVKIMEENQLVAIIIVIVIIGAAGAYLLMIPSNTDDYQTQEIEIVGSYVMAEGDFDCVDVFFQYASNSLVHDALWAHIDVDGKKYAKEYGGYTYHSRNKVYLKFIVHLANDTVCDAYEITIAVGHVYSFYINDVLITVYYK